MNENKQIENQDGIEIDSQQLFSALWQKKWMIILASLAGAVAALLISVFLITPEYQSSVMFYVNNSSLSVGDASFSIDSGDISASKSLVESYIVILKTRESLNDVIDYAGVNRTYSQLVKMIEATSVNSTEIFEVVVTSTDPQEAEKIANAIAYILPKRISSIIEGTSAKVVDAAVMASKPSSPSYTINTLLGFAVGFVLAISVIVLRKLFDVTIRSEEDIQHVCSYPVLASVPDMVAAGKKGYSYGYGYRESQGKKSPGVQNRSKVLVGESINFAASEAYKLLRTKLGYSFADDSACRVICMSSAMTGEGKSLTAVNLAYTLSQLGERVLLIDCDMRRPSIPAKLPIKKNPGLSTFLSGQSTEEFLIQLCGLEEDQAAFHVIASGPNPPNPVELLSSARMRRLLECLRNNYEYIILDLPPIGEVSDALAVAKETDGIVLVVRQDCCNRIALSSAIRQFEFVDSKILGVVYNCASEETGAYGKNYGKKYYKKYYASADKTSKSERT